MIISAEVSPESCFEQVLAHRRRYEQSLRSAINDRWVTGKYRVRVSADDFDALTLLIRYRCLTVEQIATAIDRHPEAVRRRMRSLRDAGWLRSIDGGPSRRRVLIPTPQLTRAAGLRKTDDPGSWSRMRHRLLVAEAGLIRERIPRAEVVTEYEIATCHGRPLHIRLKGDAHAANLERQGYRAVQFFPTHLPDLVARVDASLWAIEVELSRKSEAALATIMRAYHLTQRVKAVEYLVPSETIAEPVRHAAQRCNLPVVLRPVPAPSWLSD